MNVICLGGRVVANAFTWELVRPFLQARFSSASVTTAVWPKPRGWKAGEAECVNSPGLSGRSDAKRRGCDRQDNLRKKTSRDNLTSFHLREKVFAESLGYGEDFPFITPRGAPRGAILDTFLIFLGITLNMGVNAERRVTAVTSRHQPLESSSVPCLATLDLLSIDQFTGQSEACDDPRAVCSRTERQVSRPRLCRTHLEHRTHMIFEADLTRLSSSGKGVKSRGRAREAYFAGMRRWNDEKSPTKTERGSRL